MIQGKGPVPESLIYIPRSGMTTWHSRHDLFQDLAIELPERQGRESSFPFNSVVQVVRFKVILRPFLSSVENVTSRWDADFFG